MGMTSMPGGVYTGGQMPQLGLPGGPQFNPGAGAGFGFNPDTGDAFGVQPPQIGLPVERPGDAFGIQGNAPAPSPLPTDGMSGGKGIGPISGMLPGIIGGQMPTLPGAPQLGLPVERPGQGIGQLVGGPADKPIIGTPGGPQFNPQPQPVNRFAPPNAPGVRMQPRVSAVNQANPRNISNRFTRTRAR